MASNDYAETVARESRQSGEAPIEAVNRLWETLGVEAADVVELAKRALASMVSQKLTTVNRVIVTRPASNGDGVALPKESRFLASLVYVSPDKSKTLLNFTVEDWQDYRARCAAAVHGFARRIALADMAIKLMIDNAAETTGALPIEALRELGTVDPGNRLTA